MGTTPVSTLSDLYVHKTTEVVARKWDGSMGSALDILEWLASYNVPARFLETNETISRDSPEIVLQTPDGNKHARAGNWIVNEDGTWFLFSAGSFRRLYEKKEKDE